MRNIDIINRLITENREVLDIEDAEQKTSQYFFKINQDPKEPIFCVAETDKKNTKKNILGRGAFGVVYKAKILNPKTGDPVPHEYIAIKSVLFERFNSEEHKISSDRTATGEPIACVPFMFLPLGFISGEPMGDYDGRLNPILETLTDEEKLNLAIDFLQECEEMHQKWIHGDLKGGNLLLQKLLNNQNKKIFKIHIIDWGMALPVENKPIIRRGISASTQYHPPEAKNDVWGIFTDIYMMSAVLAIIFRYNNNYGPKNSAIYETKFTPEGFKHLNFGEFIIVSMINYLNRMRDTDYNKRPDKNQPHKFFLLLKELNTLNQLPKEKQNLTDFRILKTKIYLLSSSNWTDQSDHLNEEDCINFIKNSEKPEDLRQNVSLIWSSISTSVEKIEDEKNSDLQKPKNDLMSTRKNSTDLSKNLESKKSTLTQEQLNDRYKKILKIIINKIENLPEYNGSDAKEIRILKNEDEIKKYETGSSNLKRISSLFGLAPKLQIRIKSVSPHMEKIYCMAVPLMADDNRLKRFGYFRDQALSEIEIMKKNTSLSFFNTTEDYRVSTFIKDLLEPTKKEEQQVVSGHR